MYSIMKKALVYSLVLFSFMVAFPSPQSFAAISSPVKVHAFNNFPVIFKDTDGVVKGLYVDLLTEIGKKENIKFEYVLGTWSEGLERI